MIHKILKTRSHREYPLPAGPWILMQKWEHLLFMSWPVSVDWMDKFLPPGLEMDTYDGSAWISVIPFKVSDERLRALPSMPLIHSYLELNVRTYVKRNGVSGVYFFNLDVNQLLTVFGARLVTLPYFYAKMKFKEMDSVYDFSSIREGDNLVKFKGQYEPAGPAFYPKKGSIDYWLVERYFLWTYKGGKLYRAGLHHDRWKIQNVNVGIKELSLSMLPGTFPGTETVVYYAREKVTLNWAIHRDN